MTALVVCVGIVVLDEVFEVAVLPHAASKYAAISRREVAGGIAANAAMAVARLGGAARLVSRVAKDTAGQRLRAVLDDAGVDCSGLQTPASGVTSTSAVFVDPQGERMLVNHKDPALFEGTPKASCFAGAAAVMCDLRWPEAARLGLATATKAGLPAVLDYDLAPEQAADMIPLASHVIFSEGALFDLAGGEHRRAALEDVAKRYPSVAFAVTAGPEGAFWIAAGCNGHVPAVPVRAVDTLGAGDVFHGAAALGLAEGLSFPEALRFASAAAALKVSQPSGLDAFPTRSEVEQIMESRP
ncbi:hypothetical protein HBA54_14420 [Pelagibius litoralis]|uniref:Carbohydrate kinase PfkB domain-containing protein n=1 Tax=Pelagibius litoralis TaxID=374515 RepID=A0A967KCP9_9PROT|nr:PfkB family carbohydrate kinase [Pelagibius litoralis]NIA69795.1 hypothetical protein [Pelagibius litoralis]